MHEYFCWACDFSKTSGEGRLANLFINKISSFEKKIKVFTVKKFEIKYKIITKILNHKYISPFVGIIFFWFFFFKKKNIIYINYLPLWNFFLFALLPPTTILGPITGGANFNEKYQYIIRKYFFVLFYKISQLFLSLRKQKLNFSTDLLKKELNNCILSNSNFNYVFFYLKRTEVKKKNNDFLIYYRKHPNKVNLFPYKFVRKLIALNFKVIIAGDKLDMFGVKNIGHVSNKKINMLLSKSFFSILSSENPYSFFSIECINNNVKIIAERKHKNKINFFTKNFLFLDFNKIYEIKHILERNR